MSLQLKHKVFDDYLWVEITGTRTLGQEAEEGILIWKKVANIAKKEGKKLILIKSKAKGRLPVSSALEITQVLSQINWGWQYGIKVAGVAPDRVIFTNISIYETIMEKLGYKGKVFLSEKDAKKWLTDS